MKQCKKQRTPYINSTPMRVARQCAQSRADAAYWEAIKNNKLRYLEEANSQLTQTIDQQASQIDQQASRIAELEAALAKQNK